jgi:hypothetical protein
MEHLEGSSRAWVTPFFKKAAKWAKKWTKNGVFIGEWLGVSSRLHL